MHQYSIWAERVHHLGVGVRELSHFRWRLARAAGFPDGSGFSIAGNFRKGEGFYSQEMLTGMAIGQGVETVEQAKTSCLAFQIEDLIFAGPERDEFRHTQSCDTSSGAPSMRQIAFLLLSGRCRNAGLVPLSSLRPSGNVAASYFHVRLLPPHRTSLRSPVGFCKSLAVARAAGLATTVPLLTMRPLR